MKIYIFFLMVISISLNGFSLDILGSDDSFKKVDIKNSIVWILKDNRWLIAKPLELSSLEDKKGYVLAASPKKEFSSVKQHKEDSYTIKKGWNFLSSPKNGIDILRSFENPEYVEFVYTYDEVSKQWAGFSPDKSLQEKMLAANILFLRYIEPQTSFYVYARQETTIDIKSTQINEQCQKALDKGFKTLIATGKDKQMVFDQQKTIGIESRYISHFRKNIYNDTRVALIYRELNKNSSGELKHYGTAKPSIKFKYAKEREDSIFFVYDYFLKECFLGAFPSKKLPPFSTLKIVK